MRQKNSERFQKLTVLIPSDDRNLVISTFQAHDISVEYVSWLNDKSLMRYSNQRFLEHTWDTCEQYLASFLNTPNQFLAIKNSSGNLVGTMTMYVQDMHGTVDLGIMIGPAYASRGIGTHAWLTVCTHLENDENIRKITAGCASSNLPMIRLAEKSGMTLEGRRLQQEIYDDVAVDILLYGKMTR